MAKGITFVVYVLPVALSLIFGTIVISGILQEPDRELNFAQMGSFGNISLDKPLKIIGLQKQYSTSDPVQIQVIIEDISFSCGDLYISIYTLGNSNVITQSGYFEQCFDSENPFLPNNARFSEIVDNPGRYEIVVEFLDKDQENSITTSEEFNVK